MSSRPPFPAHVAPAAIDWRDGMPYARDFDDVYFSADGGIAESTHVFLEGNDLPARFRAGGFREFTLGETGFGTGLNLLLAMRAFLALAPPDARLHLVSVEKFPLTAEDMARAHAQWPELAGLSAALREALPPACSGFHHRALLDGRVRLTLLYGDAAALLPRLDARVDAWFLDGFAPARNDGLWTPALFAQLAGLSTPGATFATFTAAGDVRRGLAAAGFAVERVTGFGRKREMLRGAFQSGEKSRAWPAPAVSGQARRAAVIGGGLAGCAAARALAERGWQVTLYERNAALADETSGNLAGAVYPKFSLHETPQNRWYRDSYLYALARLPQVLGAPDSLRWSRTGLLQLPSGDEDANAQAQATLCASRRWPPEVLALVDAAAASAHAGVRLPVGALWFPGAAWVHPPALCAALADHPRIAVRCGTAVESVTHEDGHPCVDGERVDAVVVANALAATQFPCTQDLPLRRVRGQVTHVAATVASRALAAVVCHEGYVTPAREGLHCVGATFGPRDRDASVRDDDHEENLANLARACPSLHAALGGESAAIRGGRTGFRAQTPDYLPVIGAVAADITSDGAAVPLPGVYVLAALGAKGLAFSLLGAEIIAAMAGGEPLPVDAEVAAALAPARFRLRAWRREARQRHDEPRIR